MLRNSQESDSLRQSIRKFTRRDILICASHGYVYAIHKSDGSRLWKTSFKSGSGIISLFVRDNDRLIAGACGRTACLNLLNGGIVWENKMTVSFYNLYYKWGCVTFFSAFIIGNGI